MERGDPVAYIVLRGEDESTSIVLDHADAARIIRSVEDAPTYSPSDDEERDALLERLARLVTVRP